MKGVIMSSDRATTAAEEVPAWKRAAKKHLASLVPQYGSQRKLALAWLGDVDKASQVSEWCSTKTSKFPETANLVKLRSLGVSIDWLLSGESARDDDDEWPADRVAALSAELEAYCGRVVSDAGRSVSHASVSEHLLTTTIVYQRVRGDFLQYLTQHLNRLTERICENVSLPGVYRDARRWRQAQRDERAARAKSTPTKRTPTTKRGK